jgi:hypothetical protein
MNTTTTTTTDRRGPIPSEVVSAILDVASSQNTRRRLARTLGTWYVHEWRAVGSGRGAAGERARLARFTRIWRAAAPWRPCEVRRAVLTLMGGPRA